MQIIDELKATKFQNQFSIHRREFITGTIAGLAVTSLAASPFSSLVNSSTKIRAIAFDAFPIFDTGPVFALAGNMFAEKGTELGNVWRTKQFEYSWLRAAAGRYNDFWKVTEDALIFAARKTGVTLSADNKEQLMKQYLSLDIWPDVLPALQTFKQNGIRLSFLSNMTIGMLDSSMKRSGIESYFENVISTDSAKTYKPNPIAYQLGVDILKLKKEEILFVAFAGWDASGAKWFGYPAFWMNRSGTPAEELNAIPDGMGKSMNDLVNFLKL